MLTKEHIQKQLCEAAAACKSAERLLAGDREPQPLDLAELSVTARKLSASAAKLTGAIKKALAKPPEEPS